MNAKGAFWFCTYEGGLNTELLVALLQKMMKYRRKLIHLIIQRPFCRLYWRLLSKTLAATTTQPDPHDTLVTL